MKAAVSGARPRRVMVLAAKAVLRNTVMRTVTPLQSLTERNRKDLLTRPY